MSKRPPSVRTGPGVARSLWAVLLALLAVVLAAGGWFARQVLHARSDLTAAAAQARTLEDALASGDRAQAHDALTRLQTDAAGARSSTSGVLWRAGSHLPVVGGDLAAVRTVSSVLDDLSQKTLPPVVAVADSLDVANFRPHHGRLDLAPLRRLAPVTGPARRQVAAADERVRRIDTGALLPQLQGPVTELQDKLGEAARLVGSADTAARLLPSMLGGDGPRHYLVVFQNNAEVRATGGLPGAFAVVTADHGRISLGRQGALSSFPRFANPVLPLTAAEREIYTSQLGVYAGDTTLTPDFPRAAQLSRAMWRRVSGQQVDGVLSVDPVALSYLLSATGPVDLGGGRQLTAGNAVPLLLHDVYVKLDPAAQDRFFAAAAGKVFAAVSSGQGDPRRLMSAIARGVDEGRVLVWSASPGNRRCSPRPRCPGRCPPLLLAHRTWGSTSTTPPARRWTTTSTTARRRGRQRVRRTGGRPSPPP